MLSCACLVSVPPPPPPLSAEEAARQREVRTGALLLRMQTVAATDGSNALDVLTAALRVQKTTPLSASHQDARGCTLLQYVIAMCVAMEAIVANMSQHLNARLRCEAALERFRGVRYMVAALLRDSDLTRRNAEGWDALGLLTRSTLREDWWLTEVVLNLGADVNARGPDGSTPLLRWAASPHTAYDDMQLNHSGDLTLTDACGNSILHLLITAGNHLLLKALIVEDDLFTHSVGICFAPNAAGVTPLQLTASMQEGAARTAMHQSLLAGISIFDQRIRPCIYAALEPHLPVVDLVCLCCEYIDGTGRPWTTPREEPSAEPIAAVQA
jgi:hypothetical protein